MYDLIWVKIKNATFQLTHCWVEKIFNVSQIHDYT